MNEYDGKKSKRGTLIGFIRRMRFPNAATHFRKVNTSLKRSMQAAGFVRWLGAAQAVARRQRGG